jgi:hypothetical protein
MIGDQRNSSVPTYEEGDFIKVEFADETTGVGEWMWVRVRRCDDSQKIVFGSLDSVPVNDHDGKLKLGTELAVSFAKIRDHRKSSGDSPVEERPA